MGGIFWDTLDLDSLTIFILGGVFWDTLDLDSLTIFIWGGILGHLRFGLYDNFHFGGYSGTPWIWTLTIFILEGVFWETSDLDSLTIFILGGGEGRGVFYRIGVFCGIWTKISTTPAGSCIMDSLSHTTYVETNKFMCYKNAFQ